MGTFIGRGISPVAPQADLERAKADYENAKRKHAESLAMQDLRATHPPKTDDGGHSQNVRDFMIGVATGIPLPSPGGIIGASLHTQSSNEISNSSSSSSSSSDYSGSSGDSGGGGSSGDF